MQLAAALSLWHSRILQEVGMSLRKPLLGSSCLNLAPLAPTTAVGTSTISSVCRAPPCLLFFLGSRKTGS